MGGVDLEDLHTPGHTQGLGGPKVGGGIPPAHRRHPLRGSMGRTLTCRGKLADAMRASSARLGGLEGTLTVLPGHMGPLHAGP